MFYLILCLDASQKKTLGRLQTTLCNSDTYNAVILECFNVQSSFWALMKGYTYSYSVSHPDSLSIIADTQ